MTTRKHYAAALIALGTLALAGCGHSSDSGGAPGPNATDQAATAHMQAAGGPQAAAQAAAAQAAAAKAAQPSAATGTPQNPPK